MPRFLVLHGLHGSGPDHWQAWLIERLRANGCEVRAPAMPDPDTPDSAAWAAVLERELAALPPGPGSVVVCHSLGSVTWLRHVASAAPEARVERVALVAPPSEGAGLPEIAGFFPVPLDGDALRAAAGETRMICSDEDPYCPGGAASVYGEPLGIEVDLVPGAEHLNTDAGLGPWPALLGWCLGERDDPRPDHLFDLTAYAGAKNGVDT